MLLSRLPIFVINLERDVDRRVYMEAELAKLNLSAEFVPGVDGKALGAGELSVLNKSRSLRVYGVEMLPAEIGCYLSHYRLFQRMVDDDVPYALILEDDLEFDLSFPEVVEVLLREQVEPWKVIRLTTLREKVAQPQSPKFEGKQIRHLVGPYRLFRLSTHVLGAGAYLISQDGAQALCTYGKRIFMPIDHTMDRFWENGITPYVVRPFPVRQRQDFSSSIGERDPGRRHNMPPLVRLQRRIQRLQDSLGKRIFNLRNR